MEMTTLCYIEKNGKYLMMHRTLKENDPNKDKWIGIGGHFEEGESPEECLLREVYEETGLQLTSFNFRGVVTFTSNKWNSEYMFLFNSDSFLGEVKNNCCEGVLRWVDKKKTDELTMWEGDRIFLQLLESEDLPFLLKLEYEDDKLTSSFLNGEMIF